MQIIAGIKHSLYTNTTVVIVVVFVLCLLIVESEQSKMRVTTPEINWHNRDPVYSVDFCPRDNAYILATCGTDCFVRLWGAEIAEKTEGEAVKIPTPTKSKGLKDGEEALEEEVKINHLATLVRHTKAVNVVRFSSDGRILASAGKP